ncbi:MAG: SDR family oxidoreductase [Streptosporangiaceae bacterium]|jgi:NAD(P)-dependent dehydrogenase (short-subunit alcohol dehydrogenase family)
MSASLVIGGASDGVGGVVARKFADRGDTVIITSRDSARAEAAAKEIGGDTRGLAIDLSQPETIAAALESVTEVDNVVITAMPSIPITLADFRIDAAIQSVTVKLVGYAEAVRVLRGRFRPGASVVLFGGLAKERPYPGSTMVTTFNAGLTGLVKTLAAEIAPHRVNAVHPGLIGDSPKWRDVPNHPHIAATPIGRLVTMGEVADAADFLLRNTGMNAQDLYIDGGFLIR